MREACPHQALTGLYLTSYTAHRSSMERSTPTILVADDNALNRRLLCAVFEAEDFKVVLAQDGESALSRIASDSPAVVLLDLRMPGLSGMEVLAKIKALAPELPVILITAHGEISAAVEAMKLGAYDFLTRPMNNEQLVLTVRRALERHHLINELHDLRSQLSSTGALAKLVGPSEAIQKVVHQIQQVAASKFTVLIQGETGTGKELVARAIHQHSDRGDKTFVPLDCGAIPETLLESELFGYEKGAFSGAHRRKEGHFQIADGGTLFLDEIGNLPFTAQGKLLRVIQERQVQLLGSSSTTPVDARLVAATNDYLDTQVEAGRFRQDLYYRLAEFTILLPPLRHRRDDILPLARRFQEEASLELGRRVCGISKQAGELLVQYGWPGNVRELRNVIRQAVLKTAHPTIQTEDVRHLLTKHRSVKSSAVASIPVPLGLSLKEISKTAISEAEKQAIVEALKTTLGNKSKAARLLKVDYKTLHVKMKQYGVGQADPEPA